MKLWSISLLPKELGYNDQGQVYGHSIREVPDGSTRRFHSSPIIWVSEEAAQERCRRLNQQFPAYTYRVVEAEVEQ